MNDRINLDNHDGWFDIKKAAKIKEGTWWNGNNHISHATGTQWDHQDLYRTASGKWVVGSWSQWQGVRETYELVDDEIAYSWLQRCEIDIDDIPDTMREGYREYLANKEI